MECLAKTLHCSDAFRRKLANELTMNVLYCCVIMINVLYACIMMMVIGMEHVVLCSLRFKKERKHPRTYPLIYRQQHSPWILQVY